MHRPKSYHMTRTCRHHMLLVGGVGFYSKITFLTPISRSKVIRRSKSCDMVRQGQWSLWPSLVMISHVMTEVHVQTWSTETWSTERRRRRRRRRICLWQNKTPVGGLVTSHGDMAHKTAPSNCDEYDLWPQIVDPKVNTSKTPCMCAIVITKLLNIYIAADINYFCHLG